MTIISEDEAKLAASIMKTWCMNKECKNCFAKIKGLRCTMPINWNVPFIHSNDGVEREVVRKDEE